MTKREGTRSIPITKDMVWAAYRKVKANQGSCGVDGLSLKDFERNLDKNLYKIWNRLSSGSYFPPPLREIEIPKKDGNKRRLGIPTVGDRIAQQVLKGYLEPRLEAEFHANSYGYRPSRSAQDAVEAVRKNVREHGWVIDMDIKSFFDEVDHDLLMKALGRHVEENWVKLYIKRWLEMPVQEKTGQLRLKRGKGTPQGGVISPLLANLFLHYAFDLWMGKYYPQLSFVRYADDIIIHCDTEAEAYHILNMVKSRLKSCKLDIHDGKTKIVYCQDYRRENRKYQKQFDFLGFSFQPRLKRSTRRQGKSFLGYDCAISTSSRKRIIAEIRGTRFHRWSTNTIEDLARVLNPKLRGWVNYYGKFGKSELGSVFRIFHNRLIRWILNRYKSLGSSRRKAYNYLKQLQRDNMVFYHWKKGFVAL